MNTFLRGMMLALAFVAPWIALAVAAGPERWTSGLAVAPFGWQSVVSVYLLATIPLAYGLTALGFEGATRSGAGSRLTAWRAAWLAVAATSLWLTMRDPAVVGAWSAGDVAGPTARYIVRCLWSLAVVLPWCALAVSTSATQPRAARMGNFIAPAVVLTALATIVPWAYTQHVVRDQTAATIDLLSRGKYAAAQVTVLGLCDLGSDEPIDGQAPLQVAQLLARRTAEYLDAIKHPLADDAPADERIARATLHAQFGELDLVRAELATLAESHVDAALLLAAAWQDAAEYDESSPWYQRALDLAGQNDLEAATRALDGLAFNARAVGDHRQAAEYYSDGLQSFPTAAAHFHFQLARHYQFGGQPWQALGHFNAAARLEPARYRDAVEREVARLRTSTPACWTWP